MLNTCRWETFCSPKSYGFIFNISYNFG